MSYKILGTCDSVTECDCCGKKGLKKTVALSNEGSIIYYGTQCAALALMGSKAKGNAVDQEARAGDYVTRLIEKGYGLRTAAEAMGRKFGFQWEIKDSVLHFGAAGMISA